MPLDPSILAQGKPFQTPDPLQNYAKVLQIQGAQQQQKVSQMQIEEMQRDREEMVKFQDHLSKMGMNPDLDQYAQALLNTGNKKNIEMGIELSLKLKNQAKLNEIMGGGAAAPANALAPASVAPSASANALAPGVAPAVAAPTNALRGTALPAPGPRGGMPGGMPTAMPAPPGTPVRTAPTTPMGAGGTAVQGAIPQEAQAILNKINGLYALGTPQAINIAKGLESQLKFYETTPAQKATDVREQQRIALEQRRVELAEKEAARKETGLAELPPKEIQKREAVFPQAKLAVNTVGKTMETIEETIDRLLANETGLNGITGLIYGNTPPLTDAARKANADLGQLKNLAFVQGITELRAASKTGAGVGSVSDREGNRFENLKASLDRSQSLQDLKDSLVRLKSNAQFTKHSLQEAFDETYQYKQDERTAKPVAKPQLSARDQQALDWANANSKDPRAAQIKQRLEAK